MSQIVEYVLSLRDNLTAGIEGANVKAEELEGTLRSVGGALGVIGVSMAAFAGFEGLKSAHEQWEKLEFSISQVRSSLQSTGGAAGLSFEQVEHSAETMAKSVKYNTDEILGMQSVLLTFPAVTSEAFDPASKTIMDMSTKLGKDLKQSAIQVGKALQDPVHGITALRREGVNFSDSQTHLIKGLAETNHLAEAQTLILRELNKEFGGSAQAAFAADSAAQFDKALYDLRTEAGHLVDDLEKDLMPSIIDLLHWLKESFQWIEKNKSTVKNLVVTLGEMATAYLVVTRLIVPLVAGLGEVGVAAGGAATGVATATTEIEASTGPIGLAVAAIGALIFSYNELADAADSAEKSQQKLYSDSTESMKKDMDKRVSELEKTMSEAQAVLQTKKEYADFVAEGISTTEAKERVILKANDGDTDDPAYKDLQTANAIWYHRQKSLADYAAPTNENLVKPATKPSTKALTGTTVPKEPTTKATGSKSVTINVRIDKLGEISNMNVTNVKEGAKNVHEEILKALTGAVNDFQIVAGQ